MCTEKKMSIKKIVDIVSSSKEYTSMKNKSVNELFSDYGVIDTISEGLPL